MASHFAPAGRIEPVVIVGAAVSILLGLTLEPEEERTSNKVLMNPQPIGVISILLLIEALLIMTMLTLILNKVK